MAANATDTTPAKCMFTQTTQNASMLLCSVLVVTLNQTQGQACMKQVTVIQSDGDHYMDHGGQDMSQ